MKPLQFLSLFLLISLNACASGGTTFMISTSTVTDTLSPTNKPTILPTETPTITLTSTPAEKPTAQDIWLVSPDGHIAYNESQLYGGLFTIDTEHPEYAQKYWEGLVRVSLESE